MNKIQKIGTGVGVGVTGVAALIIAAVLNVEGGYVNNPKDPGGETNHGITVAVAREHGYQGDMRELTRGIAEEIYYQDYIVKPGFSRIVPIQPAVAHKLVDAGVNTGTTRPSRWFQQTLNDLSHGGADYPQINVDGKVGPATITAYQRLEQKRGKVKACELTIKLLDSYQATYYTSLNMPTFTVGWLDHRIGNVPLSWCQEYRP